MGAKKFKNGNYYCSFELNQKRYISTCKVHYNKENDDIEIKVVDLKYKYDGKWRKVTKSNNQSIYQKSKQQSLSQIIVATLTNKLTKY